MSEDSHNSAIARIEQAATDAALQIEHASTKAIGRIQEVRTEKVQQLQQNVDSAVHRIEQRLQAVHSQVDQLKPLVDGTAQTLQTTVADISEQRQRLSETMEQLRTAGTDGVSDVSDATAEASSQAHRFIHMVKDAYQEIDAKLVDFRKIHGIAAETEIAGTHDQTGHEERKAADKMRKSTFRWRIAAGVAAAAFSVFSAITAGSGDWLQLIIGAPVGVSIVAVLVWTAKYAADQSAAHRLTAHIYKHQALALASLPVYSKILHDNETQALDEKARSELMERLFTEQIQVLTEQLRVTYRPEKTLLGRIVPSALSRSKEKDE